MYKSINSYLLFIPVFLLAAVFSSFNSTVTDTKSKHLSKADSKVNSNIEIRSVAIKEESSTLKVTPVTRSSSNLVFIPSSHDFGTYGEGDIIYYGFQIKNLGGTQASGQVTVFGDQPFSCYSGVLIA